MEENRIRLYSDGQQWVGRHTGPHAAQIIDLFGTDCLPTAFRASADGERVRAAIAALNPDCDVTLYQLVTPYSDR